MIQAKDIKIGQTIITSFGEGVVTKYEPNYKVGNRTEQRWLISGLDFGGWFTLDEIKLK